MVAHACLFCVCMCSICEQVSTNAPWTRPGRAKPIRQEGEAGRPVPTQDGMMTPGTGPATSPCLSPTTGRRRETCPPGTGRLQAGSAAPATRSSASPGKIAGIPPVRDSGSARPPPDTARGTPSRGLRPRRRPRDTGQPEPGAPAEMDGRERGGGAEAEQQRRRRELAEPQRRRVAAQHHRLPAPVREVLRRQRAQRPARAVADDDPRVEPDRCAAERRARPQWVAIVLALRPSSK